jgi:hypothetical protein
MHSLGFMRRHFCLPAALVFASLTAALVIGLSAPADAQESCGNLQYQLGVLRSSGGAGSQWDTFIQQRMQQLGCLGGQSYQQRPQVGEYCANGNTCPLGTYCSRIDPSRCVPEGRVDCGAFNCEQGAVCWTARGNWPGVITRGQRSCATPEQAAEWDQKIADLERERREEARRREEERRAEIERKKREHEAEITRERWRKMAEKQQKEAEQKQKLEAKRRAEEERRAELERKKAEETLRRQQAAEAKRLAEEQAKQRMEEQRRAALHKQLEDQRNAALREYEQRQANEREQAEKYAIELERKATAARQKAAEQAERTLLAAMNNKKETIEYRKIAAIALGKNPDLVGSSSSKASVSDGSRKMTDSERKLMDLAMGKVQPAAGYQKPQSMDDMLRATLNNPKESLAARQLAAIGLGLDPKIVTASSTQVAIVKRAGPAVSPAPAPIAGVANSSYTFAKTQYGTVEVFDHGQRIATVTPELATQNYGYNPVAPTPANSNAQPSTGTKAANSLTPVDIGKSVELGKGVVVGVPVEITTIVPSTTKTPFPDAQKKALESSIATLKPGPGSAASSNTATAIPSGNINSQVTGFFASSSPQTHAVEMPSQNSTLWKNFLQVTKQNEAMLDSRPGQIVVDTLKAAGGPYAGNLKRIGDLNDIAQAADKIRRKDFLALAEQGADKVAVTASGAIGGLMTPSNPMLGESVASASTQAVLTSWKVYGAPVVGDWLVQKFPNVFIPSSNTAQ